MRFVPLSRAHRLLIVAFFGSGPQIKHLKYAHWHPKEVRGSFQRKPFVYPRAGAVPPLFTEAQRGRPAALRLGKSTAISTFSLQQWQHVGGRWLGNTPAPVRRSEARPARPGAWRHACGTDRRSAAAAAALSSQRRLPLRSGHAALCLYKTVSRKSRLMQKITQTQKVYGSASARSRHAPKICLIFSFICVL